MCSSDLLYRRLTDRTELRTVTVAEATADARLELPGIFPGSWIDANFYIWIGHADDQRAWSQLADARQALSTVPAAGPSAEARAKAFEEILVAEGSDWCWWYGDDHSSAHDLEFDDLFRRHLRNAYQLLGKTVPDELFVSNISQGLPPPVLTQPNAWLSPRLDGDASLARAIPPEPVFFERRERRRLRGSGRAKERGDDGHASRGHTGVSARSLCTASTRRPAA